MRKIGVIGVIIISLVAFLSGIILGIMLQSSYPIDIDNKIRYSEILNWITTVAIGVLVGFVLRNQFENNKTIKTYLIEDVRSILTDIQSISTYFRALKDTESLNEDQRREINSKMNSLDKRIGIFCELLADNYQSHHEQIRTNLINNYNNFNREVSGDGLYAQKVTTNYFDGIIKEAANFESSLKKLITTIIRNM